MMVVKWNDEWRMVEEIIKMLVINSIWNGSLIIKATINLKIGCAILKLNLNKIIDLLIVLT